MSSDQEKVLVDRIKEGIEGDSTKRLGILLGVLRNKSFKTEMLFIDKPLIQVGEYRFNCLGYSAYIGSSKVFKLLFESGASLRHMEELFFSQNLRTITLVCEKGHLTLLKFYLPLYMRHFRSSIASFRTSTLDLTESQLVYEYAIHAACRTGMINIVSYLYNYFKAYPVIPTEFSLDTLDDNNRDDVGLIAVRSGSFLLVKLLFENCGVRFDQVNKYNENAVLVCVQADKQTENFSYLEILIYLVEVVKVDVLFMYEEVLLTAENPKIVRYLEEKLQEVGVFVRKDSIEKELRKTRVIRDSLASNGLREAFGLNSYGSSITSDLVARETPLSFVNFL